MPRHRAPAEAEEDADEEEPLEEDEELDEEEEEEDWEAAPPRRRSGRAATRGRRRYGESEEDEEEEEEEDDDDDVAQFARGQKRRRDKGAGLTARQRKLHGVPAGVGNIVPRFRVIAPTQRQRDESPGEIERKEAAKQRLKERKQAEAREATQAAMAKVLSGEGSRKKRDMKAQRAQEERLAAKRADAGVQPGMVRRIQRAEGTVLLFAAGERPYFQGPH